MAARSTLAGQISPLQFFSKLKWIDGRPLLDTIEPYRRAIFDSVLWTFDKNGRPQFNMALCGRAKKCFKTTDLALAALFRFTIWRSPHGNACAIIAADEDQAADDLSLLKLLISVNPVLQRSIKILAKEVVRLDTGDRLRILPSQDAQGLHGKSFNFLGIDELHTAKDYSVLEALAQDPTRGDTLTWMTSYASIHHRRGAPLYDYTEIGKAGADPRFFFSWYAADYTTDPDFAGEGISPEARANPSMASWDDPDGYLKQQKARLPAAQYRRLHLNLPGAPEGAAFDAAAIAAAVVTGRRRLPYDDRHVYIAGCDMSGGSRDYACLAILHEDPESGKTVLDVLINQGAAPPFDPRIAVSRFCDALKEFRVFQVHGDAYGGNVFRADFEARGIAFKPIIATKHVLYSSLEAPLLAGELEWLDVPELADEAMGLVYRGQRIDHTPNGHDDHINAVAVATFVARQREPEGLVVTCWVGTNENSSRALDRWSPDYGDSFIPADYSQDRVSGTSADVRRILAARGEL